LTSIRYKVHGGLAVGTVSECSVNKLNILKVLDIKVNLIKILKNKPTIGTSLNSKIN